MKITISIIYLTILSTILLTENKNTMTEVAKNVLGTNLEACCYEPKTGFYRDGFCHTGPTDYGRHVVCGIMTQEFLDFTKAKGNDLCTPIPQYRFPGLKAGDKWCLCALRWREAKEAGKAPPVILSASHENALRYVKLADLKAHAYSEKEH